MDVLRALCQNKIKSSDKVQSFHYLSQLPIDFTITHQFYHWEYFYCYCFYLWGKRFHLTLKGILFYCLSLNLKAIIPFIFITIYEFHCSFLVQFIYPTILFQLTFPFIYSTFNKNFQFQQNKQISNTPLWFLNCYQKTHIFKWLFY